MKKWAVLTIKIAPQVIDTQIATLKTKKTLGLKTLSLQQSVSLKKRSQRMVFKIFSTLSLQNKKAKFHKRQILM